MKLITMFSKREYVVADDEATNVAKATTQNTSMIQLRSGDYINPRGIESIGDVPMVKMYKGYFVEKDGKSYIRDGQRIAIEYPKDIYLEPEIVYHDQIYRIEQAPRLEGPEVNHEGLKALAEMKKSVGKSMQTNKQRTEMQEEMAMGRRRG